MLVSRRLISILYLLCCSKQIATMECFGDIQKVPTHCHNIFPSHTKRYSKMRDSHEILVSESANLVTAYRIDQQPVKAIQSWSFDELNKLCTSLVVYGEQRNCYGAVHSCNTLIEWTLDEQSSELKQIFKKSFKKPILNLVPLSKPVVVFADGSAAVLNHCKSEDFAESDTRVIDENEIIVGLEGCVVSRNLIVYYVTKDKDSQVSFYKVVFPRGKKRFTSKKLTLSQPIECWTMSSTDNNFLGARKSGGTIEVYNLDPRQSETTQELHCTLEDTSIQKLSAIACCSEAICILGTRPEGEHQSEVYVLELYDPQFGARLGHVILHEPVYPNDFSVINNTAIVTCKNHIVVVPVVKQRMLLSKLLTKSLTQSAGSETKSQNMRIMLERLSLRVTELDKVPDLAKLTKIEGKTSQLTIELTEEVLVTLLDYITRHYQYYQSAQDEEKRDLCLVKLTNLFSWLIKRPFNEVFLVSCLKSSSISFEYYLLTMNLLLDMLPCSECSVIMWLSALLDANFSKFIVKPSQEAIKALERIKTRLCDSIEFYEGLEPIKTILDSLLKRDNSVLSAVSKELPVVGQYSIELLTFS